MPTDTDLGVVNPDLSSPADITEIHNVLEAIIGKMTIGGQGPLSGRPAPGVQWRVYVTTDQGSGPRLDVDTGAAWFTVGPGAIPNNTITTAMIQAGQITEALMAALSVGTPELQDGAVSNPKLATNAVTGDKVDGTLKPSISAGAATEALRSLGAGAGQAVAGNDARLSDSRPPSGAAGGDLSGAYPSPNRLFRGARAYSSGVQIQNSGVESPVNIDTAIFDPQGMLNPGAHELVCQKAGYYVLRGCVCWGTTGSGGGRSAYLLVNGNRIAASEMGGSQDASMYTQVNVTTIAHLGLGDLVTLHGYQSSGGQLSMVAGYSYLEAAYVGQ